MYPQGLEAIIFDMDGVLVDSEPLHLLAMQEFLGRYDISYSEEDNREFLGQKDIVISKILIERYKLPDLTPAQYVERKENILEELIRTQAVARPGVCDLLERAKKAGVKMAVASSATMGTIDIVVDTLYIRDYFLTLCSGDQVSNGKPAPDIYLMAAKQISATPKNCIVIEDTITGLTAGRAAGMFCISIPCAATAHQDHSALAHMSLKYIDELPVEELFGSKQSRV